MKNEKKLSFQTFLNVYFRSLFLQGSFSTKYCQNLGFLWCMEPVGKALFDSDEEMSEFRRRHSEYYNGNPFMTPLVLGAVTNMEERMLKGENVSEEDIRRFKKIVGPAIGSAGDRFFWGALRPFAILCGLLTAFFWGFWGIIVFLAFYNLPNLVLRYHWLIAGYNLGPKVVIEIKNSKLDFAVRCFETAGSVLVGITAAAFISDGGRTGIVSIAAASVFTLGSIMLLRRNTPLYIVFPFAAVMAVLVSLIK